VLLLQDRGAEAVVLGCTELPLAIGAGPALDAVLVDTIDALAVASIAWVRG
jgi:aspartate racemase